MVIINDNEGVFPNCRVFSSMRVKTGENGLKKTFGPALAQCRAAKIKAIV